MQQYVKWGGGATITDFYTSPKIRVPPRGTLVAPAVLLVPPGGDCGTARGDHSAAREDYRAVWGECGPSYSPPGATRHAKQLQGPGPALQHVKPAATAVYLGSSV